MKNFTSEKIKCSEIKLDLEPSVRFEEESQTDAFELERGECALLVIDIQDRLAAVMPEREAVIERSRILIEGAGILGLPVYVTEQYPKGLGQTTAELKEVLSGVEHKVYEKISYNALLPEIERELVQKGISRIIICGMETHICVYQTARECIKRGFYAFVIDDAVCSRKESDKNTGIEAMRDMGAVIISSEAALFDLLKKAGTDEFKKISKLIK